MTRRRSLMAGVIVALLAAAPAVAQDPLDFDTEYQRLQGPWHPTCAEAHAAARETMGTYASNLDGRIVVGPCVKRGKGTTVTRIKIVGAAPAERFRVLVTGIKGGDTLQVRARRISSAAK